MRCISQSAQKQDDIEMQNRGGLTAIYLRTGHQEVPETGEQEGTHWECEEAYMECPDTDAPDVEEIEEYFEDWFDYASAWQPERQKSLAQIQADVEYIAAMAGIDLEG